MLLCGRFVLLFVFFSVNQIFHFFGVANRKIDTYGIGIEFRASHLISHMALVAATYCCITTAVVVRATSYDSSNYHYLICLSGTDSSHIQQTHTHTSPTSTCTVNGIRAFYICIAASSDINW